MRTGVGGSPRIFGPLPRMDPMSDPWPYSAPDPRPDPAPYQPPYQPPYQSPYQPPTYTPQPWAVPPSPGARYDWLARTALHRWWRPILGTAAIVAVYLGVTFIVSIAALVAGTVAGVRTVAGGSRFFRDPLMD